MMMTIIILMIFCATPRYHRCCAVLRGYLLNLLGNVRITKEKRFCLTVTEGTELELPYLSLIKKKIKKKNKMK